MYIDRKSKEKEDYREALLVKIIDRMKDAVKYEKPWMECNTAPFNLASGKDYKGMNALNLLMEGQNSPIWMTYKQITDLAKEEDKKYFVKKGEKGMEINYLIYRYKKDDDGNIIKDSNGNYEPVTNDSGTKLFDLKKYTVFNANQIENYPPFIVNDKSFEDYKPAELFIQAMKESGINIKFHSKEKAYYSPSEDCVYVPEKSSFKSEGHFYRTIAHELAHATGHHSRLDRDQTGSMMGMTKDSVDKYAKEELVAELTSYFVCAELGIPYDSNAHENHAAYLKSWINALDDKENGMKFFKESVKEAEKATDHQLKIYHNKLNTLENSQEITKEVKLEEIKSLDKKIPVLTKSKEMKSMSM